MDLQSLESVLPVGTGRLRALKAHWRVLAEELSAAGKTLPKGTRLTAAAMAQLAQMGLLRAGLFLPVYHPVRCAVLCLENEAVSAAILTAALRELGHNAELLQPPTAEDADALADVLWLAAENTDLYLITGGAALLEETAPLLDLTLTAQIGAGAVYDYRRRPVVALPAEPAALAQAFETAAKPTLLRRAGEA